MHGETLKISYRYMLLHIRKIVRLLTRYFIAACLVHVWITVYRCNEQSKNCSDSLGWQAFARRVRKWHVQDRRTTVSVTGEIVKGPWYAGELK